jgi:uncharacterized protein (TIGR03083 family)
MMSQPWVDRASYAGIVSTEGARVSEVARIGPMDARVPHMRRWRLSDVVAHLGGVHRWAAEIVSTRSMSVGRRRGRDRGDALISWFDEGVRRLGSVLADADLGDACPNFSPGSANTVAFWARRQAHETTMHRWDAESAVEQVTAIEPMFASDGIDELFDVFTRTRGRQELTDCIVFACTDVDASWTVFPAGKPGRVAFERGTTSRLGAPVAKVSGRAEDLLLALWHRRTVADADLTVTGQAAVAEAFISGPVSP